MKNRLLIITIVSLLSGCASFDEYCTGAAVGGAVVGGINPLGLPCTAYNVIKIGKGIGGMISGPDSPQVANEKTFEVTPKLNDAMASDPKLVEFVLQCQVRYKAKDYGAASDELKGWQVGRYEPPNSGKPILIADKVTRWRVSYEGE
jgi:hypothetical protein